MMLRKIPVIHTPFFEDAESVRENWANFLSFNEEISRVYLDYLDINRPSYAHNTCSQPSQEAFSRAVYATHTEIRPNLLCDMWWRGGQYEWEPIKTTVGGWAHEIEVA